MAYKRRLIKNRIDFDTYGKRVKNIYNNDKLGKAFLIEDQSNNSRIVIRNLSSWVRSKGLKFSSLYSTFYTGSYYKGYRILIRDYHIVNGVVK